MATESNNTKDKKRPNGLTQFHNLARCRGQINGNSKIYFEK